MVNTSCCCFYRFSIMLHSFASHSRGWSRIRTLCGAPTSIFMRVGRRETQLAIAWERDAAWCDRLMHCQRLRVTCRSSSSSSSSRNNSKGNSWWRRRRRLRCCDDCCTNLVDGLVASRQHERMHVRLSLPSCNCSAIADRSRCRSTFRHSCRQR